MKILALIQAHKLASAIIGGALVVSGGAGATIAVISSQPSSTPETVQETPVEASIDDAIETTEPEPVETPVVEAVDPVVVEPQPIVEQPRELTVEELLAHKCSEMQAEAEKLDTIEQELRWSGGDYRDYEKASGLAWVEYREVGCAPYYIAD